ncbi:tRNA pseudouridine(55) synthase TruB [Saccharobesus litoralis]|uniref:tRNA pseudouridine synthase B n=1 Tax=Saccharobesus litoralis TaxID=2172099 RepID=A0A2S0VS87_9ALTE|nr:tRNA pseudouridine(55) synthase TruB [Saccharobesus litoralis]
MAKKTFRDLNGVILLDKAQGASSNNVMQQVRYLFQAKKAGHTGALDPLATGMLPICFGEATKFSQFLLDADKGYEVTALLGVRTDTSDADGEIVEQREVNVEAQEVIDAAHSFIGEQQQTPSIYSALKYQGKPLYYYARQGIDVPRPTRTIHFYTIEVLEVALPVVRMRVICSKGTYIRTLIDDMGEKLGCGAHVTQLRRIKVGDFPVAQMLTFEQMQAISMDELDKLLLPMDIAVQALPSIDIDSEHAERLRQGQRFYSPSGTQLGLHRIYCQAQFLGLVEVKDNGLIQPKRLLSTN